LNVVLKWSATSRVRVSAVPPAAKVLTMRTGRDGHSSAAAVEHKINALVTAAAQSRFIGFLRRLDRDRKSSRPPMSSERV
jgi:hypothetical protein